MCIGSGNSGGKKRTHSDSESINPLSDEITSTCDNVKTIKLFKKGGSDF